MTIENQWKVINMDGLRQYDYICILKKNCPGCNIENIWDADRLMYIIEEAVVFV